MISYLPVPIHQPSHSEILPLEVKMYIIYKWPGYSRLSTVCQQILLYGLAWKSSVKKRGEQTHRVTVTTVHGLTLHVHKNMLNFCEMSLNVLLSCACSFYATRMLKKRMFMLIWQNKKHVIMKILSGVCRLLYYIVLYMGTRVNAQ